MGFFDKIQDTINTATEQTKAKSQEMQLKRDRKQKIEAIGEQAYGLFLNGQLTQQELAPGCQEVAGIDQQIEAAEASYESARPAPSAPPPGQAQGMPPQPPTSAKTVQSPQTAPPPQAGQPVQPPPPQEPILPPPAPPAPPQAPAGQVPPPPPPPGQTGGGAES